MTSSSRVMVLNNEVRERGITEKVAFGRHLRFVRKQPSRCLGEDQQAMGKTENGPQHGAL